jgi:hypothetical protein
MSLHWVNPYSGYNAGSASWAGWATNYCNVRYDITSAITGNGTYNLTFSLTEEQITAAMVVVYQQTSVTTTTTVSIADGLFVWGNQGASFAGLYAGQAPIKTDLSLCGNGCASAPVTDYFTRIGGGGLWNTSGDGQYGEGNDVFVSPSNSVNSPNSSVLETEAVTALGKPGVANDPAQGGGPPYADLAVYGLGTNVVPAGATTVSWWMDNAINSWGNSNQDFFWVNVLVNAQTCP